MTLVATEDLRRQNTAAVLRSLRHAGAATRTELARRTGLAKATVGAIVGGLVDGGYVSESEAVSVSRGRPGRPVALTGSAIVGLGLEANVDYVSAVAIDLGGAVRLERTVPVGTSDPYDVVVALAREAASELGGSGARVVGATVAVPGLVDRRAGVVAMAPNLGWRGRSVAADMAAVTGLPVVVENDANCAALAEARRGATVGLGQSVYVTGTVGIGAGVIRDGAIVRGTSGFAGEVGHIPLGDPTARCGCGRRGCWEASVGLRAVLSATGLAFEGTPLQVAELISRRAESDVGTAAALEGVGAVLGRGVAAVANILDPDAVVLGGYFVPLAPYLLPAAVREVEERVTAAPHASLDLLLSALGLRAAATGAAEDALTGVFSGATAL
ncbi:ROK family transcriptional regulator [Mumia sp. zg.B53]|uniref:ROK family transcriptional regulator n=1 Tax=Mumia sp. zg.B53 TaxID=2855449 RepID=UPI001C6F4AA4|nr:ROK family transcriptional regulator [Mumia sp. zg.B53]MBW9215035.1 ROK family transcriptional regulator [Mumia sp. zg.B53]